MAQEINLPQLTVLVGLRLSSGPVNGARENPWRLQRADASSIFEKLSNRTSVISLSSFKLKLAGQPGGPWLDCLDQLFCLYLK